MSIDVDPRAKAMLLTRIAEKDLNEARLRMARIPAGADLILNKVSAAPGFRIGNVHVMAGVPTIMQAMLDEVAPTLKTGIKMLSESVRADLREGDIGGPLGDDRQGPSRCDYRQLSVSGRAAGPNTNIVVRSRDAAKLAAAKAAVEDMLAQVKCALGMTSRRAMAEPMAEPQAQPQPDKAFPVSWDQFHRDARALAWRLAEAGPFTAIVASPAAGWSRPRSLRAN